MLRRFNSRGSSVERLEERRMLAGDCFHIDCVDSVEIEVRDTFVPEVPFLVQVKLLDDDGTVNRNVWDSKATIEPSTANSTLNVDSFPIVNGVGSALVSATTTEEALSFTISVGPYQIQAAMQNVQAIAQSVVSGEISSDTTWSGVVHVTDDVTVLPDATLTIEPGTLVLIDGVETTVDEESIGSKFIVNGTLNSRGTAERPVTLTASNAAEPWGEMHVEGGVADLHHTHIMLAGNSPRGGHTSTGPAVRLTDDGAFSLTDGAISDIYGKTMQARSGQANFTRSLLTRSVMGPETQGTGVSMSETWIVDMDGRFRYDEVVDDNDGIYLHFARSPIELRGGVVAMVGDDGIDTAGAFASFEDMLVRDIHDKGFSVSGGQVQIEHCLIANVGIGVETKVATSASPQTTINRTTIVNARFGVRAEGNSSEVQNLVTNSIIDVVAEGDAISVEGDEERTIIRHSLANEDWEYGGNNVLGAASFVNPMQNDFRQRRESKATNAGDPDAIRDPDGSIMDIGFFSGRASSLNALDIDAVCAAIQTSNDDPRADWNVDGVVDLLDHDHLVMQVMGISYGDANADGRFDSKDLVLIFQVGEYEDDQIANSTWAEGDWNCDGEFNTADLVAAFQAGHYVRT